MVILCEMLVFLQGESTAFRQEHYICLNEGVCGGVELSSFVTRNRKPEFLVAPISRGLCPKQHTHNRMIHTMPAPTQEQALLSLQPPNEGLLPGFGRVGSGCRALRLSVGMEVTHRVL